MNEVKGVLQLTVKGVKGGAIRKERKTKRRTEEWDMRIGYKYNFAGPLGRENDTNCCIDSGGVARGTGRAGEAGGGERWRRRGVASA